MNLGQNYRVFLLLIGSLIIANLLVSNETTGLLFQPERLSIEQSNPEIRVDYAISNLPQRVNDYVFEASKGDPFSMRLPGIVLLILGMAGWFFLSRKLFGDWVAVTTNVILGASFAVINLSKFAIGDVWILVVNLFLFISIILNLKQDQQKWKMLFMGTLFLSFIVQNFQASIYSIVLIGSLFVFHPQGKRLKHPLFWGTPILLTVLSVLTGMYQAVDDNVYFAWRSIPIGTYLWQSFAAVLIWIGFLFGGFKDMVQKGLKKEEFSIIAFCWLLAALLSHTVILQAVFALIIAKQLHSYRLPNYPNNNIVNGFSVLQLIGSFFIAYYLMVRGFEISGTSGFRNAMVVGICYWIFNFIGVLGLYSKRIRWVMGGFAMAVILSTLLFWMRMNPFL